MEKNTNKTEEQKEREEFKEIVQENARQREEQWKRTVDYWKEQGVDIENPKPLSEETMRNHNGRVDWSQIKPDPRTPEEFANDGRENWEKEKKRLLESARARKNKNKSN